VNGMHVYFIRSVYSAIMFIDMQDLTAKMKLMEAGGESPTEPVAATDHHLYCNVHVTKGALLGKFFFCIFFVTKGALLGEFFFVFCMPSIK
jgi:hypothetical protein